MNRGDEVFFKPNPSRPILLGESPAMKHLKEMILQVAHVDFSLLIVGESGTGKELVAMSIHTSGKRHQGPFVPVNCAAIPDQLLEAELFGFRKGAFTGASSDRTGLVAEAHRGTLFLDEIGDMPPLLQAKLLRLLQEGEFRRLGENRRERVDVRVIAATHRDLHSAVNQGTFREDLLFRIQDLVLQVPPLRSRREDIPLLVEFFLKKHGGGDVSPGMAMGLAECLKHKDYPGNVRELESEVKRAITFGFRFHANPEIGCPDRSLQAVRKGWERTLLEQVLQENRWRRGHTARQLGITRQTLFNLMKKHGLRKGI